MAQRKVLTEQIKHLTHNNGDGYTTTGGERGCRGEESTHTNTHKQAMNGSVKGGREWRRCHSAPVKKVSHLFPVEVAHAHETDAKTYEEREEGRTRCAQVARRRQREKERGRNPPETSNAVSPRNKNCRKERSRKDRDVAHVVFHQPLPSSWFVGMCTCGCTTCRTPPHTHTRFPAVHSFSFRERPTGSRRRPAETLHGG